MHKKTIQNDFRHISYSRFSVDLSKFGTMEKEFILGIDIGGTFTKLGLVDQKGNITAQAQFDTRAKEPFTVFLDRLDKAVHTLRRALGPAQKVIAIGVGAPNANAHTGYLEHPPNLRWGDQVPLADSIKKRFGLPVNIANDANAAALGELEFGMGMGLKNFVVLTLGTGLGSGIISNGELLIGAHGMAGEIGHVNVNSAANARQCNCGLKGCLETYVSVTGIRRTIFELLAEMTNDSNLRSISFENMTGEVISEAALNGDAIAIKAFELTATTLGIQLADTTAHLDPEAFILLGGLSKAGDFLRKPTVKAMNENLFIAYKDKVKVLLSDTPHGHAVLGPAALAWRMNSNTF